MLKPGFYKNVYLNFPSDGESSQSLDIFTQSSSSQQLFILIQWHLWGEAWRLYSPLQDTGFRQTVSLLRLQSSDLIDVICLRLKLVVYILYFIFAQTSIQWPDKCHLSEAQFGCLYFVAVINLRPGLHWPTKPPKQKPNAAFKCKSSSICLCLLSISNQIETHQHPIII